MNVHGRDWPFRSIKCEWQQQKGAAFVYGGVLIA
jgi:hypothetical protein